MHVFGSATMGLQNGMERNAETMTQEFSYPFDDVLPSTANAHQSNLRDYASAFWRRRKNSIRAKLRQVSGAGPRGCPDDALICMLVCRNERRFLPSLLKHYRELGVGRFVIVDDQSDDGTAEFLSREPDVDLWGSKKRFAESARGKIWRERLMALYGFGRWYINIDSDEYLIPPLHDALPLKDYLRALSQRRIRRVAAPMIDFYPDGPLSEAIFEGSDERMPWQVAPDFDAEGYSGGFEASGAILRGGVRQRVFGTDMHLMKYPIIYWDRSCTLGASIHWPTPTARNVTSEWGVLLHFKIFSDVDERAAAIIENGQHMNDAAVYKTIRQHLQEDEEPTLRYDGTVRFSDAADLRQRGFLRSVVTKN